MKLLKSAGVIIGWIVANTFALWMGAYVCGQVFAQADWNICWSYIPGFFGVVVSIVVILYSCHLTGDLIEEIWKGKRK